jgi:hypothetical protein
LTYFFSVFLNELALKVEIVERAKDNTQFLFCKPHYFASVKRVDDNIPLTIKRKYIVAVIGI